MTSSATSDDRPSLFRVPRFRAIDGARGLAIVSVLLYHSGWSERGLFGVDVFFVVSGFLITLLLARELLDRGAIRMGAFYLRRAKRILPVLFLTLAGVLVLMWRVGSLEDLQSAAGVAIASVFQLANWHQIGANDAYAQAGRQIAPLGQMWSLSATEQFYVVWPVLIVIAWLLARRRLGVLAAIVLAVLVAAALAAPLMFDGTNFDRLYLGTDSRAVGFIAGGALALLVSLVLRRGPRWSGADPSPRARSIATAVSAATLATVILASISADGYQDRWLYHGGLALVSVSAAVFIATLCLPANRLSRVFEWRPLRVIGMASYEMFLLHLPVYWMLQHTSGGRLAPLTLFALGGAITSALALVVHHFFTEPIRARAWRPARAIPAVAVAAALVVGAAVLLPVQKLHHLSDPVAAAAQTDSAQAFAVDVTKSVPTGRNGSALTVAVIGDSVAANMYSALSQYGTGVRPVDVTQGGCGILDADSARSGEGYGMDTKTYCWPWQSRLTAANKAQQPDVYILHNLWDANDQLLGGEWVGPCDHPWQTRYAAQLERLVQLGDELDPAPLILLSNDHARDRDGPLSQTRLDCMYAVEARAVAAHANVRILDLESAVCPGGTCLTTTATGEQLYVDGSHFAEPGKRLLAAWLENRIATALKSGSTAIH